MAVSAGTNPPSVRITPHAPRTLRIGHFECAGEYVKDFFVFKNGSDYHLFYNVGTADGKQDWMSPGNEESFGHATSRDLQTWKQHERVMHVQGNGWEGKTVSAPSILRTGDRFSMIYTGFDKQAHGCQRIGLATSPDLFHWSRYDHNPVFEGPPWTLWKAGTWADCRDGHIFEHHGTYYLFTNVRHKDGKGGVAIARSTDLKHWQDLGPAIRVDGMPESPVVFEHRGKFYLIVGSDASACFMSDNIESNDWQRVVTFKYPPGGSWSGFEVFADGSRFVAAAFEWKLNGNYIDFWELRFEGDKPYVVYSEADLN
jgi:sucrose-6-phosphate hydrolase SacC (GH32 family)